MGIDGGAGAAAASLARGHAGVPPHPHMDSSTLQAFQLRLFARAKAAGPVVDGFAELQGADELQAVDAGEIVMDELVRYFAFVGLKDAVREAQLNPGATPNLGHNTIKNRVKKRAAAAAAATAASPAASR
jgi:hypothetical protein